MGLIAGFESFSVSINVLLNIYTFTKKTRTGATGGGFSSVVDSRNCCRFSLDKGGEQFPKKKLLEKRMNFGEEGNFLVTGFPNQFSQQIGRLHVMLNAIGH